MDEAIVLTLLSLVMLVGSYLAGSIPLVMSMSEAKLQLVSVFGAGLLVGTALSVIIPEGIRALFSSALPHKRSVTTHALHAVNEAPDFHAVIGVSLILGFIVMLLIDQISSHNRGDVEGGSGSKPKVTATVGLVVHSAVDGVALGAAATTTHTDVELIIFIAIMLHKAPAAFGLVSFLMHEGLDKKRIKKHLAIFSCSAPLMAIVTYFCIGQEGKERLSSLNATGIAMLFSAGTFLYVATVHVLPELTARVGGAFKPNQLLALVLGTLLPLLLSTGHHH
ncbi:zinc/iron regulated transporter-related protein 102B isoform X2 [Rhodnius prolixus]|uniref:Putative solute carrier family 39 zinc transporter n=1 Tax=Rhodnius prolixus TaxID=13249 RepID=R4FNE7_RHOPR